MPAPISGAAITAVIMGAIDAGGRAAHVSRDQPRTLRNMAVAKFTLEQAADVLAVQQVINDWAHDLDLHDGLHVADLLTEDCLYVVGGASRQGRDSVMAFYTERKARLEALPEGIPVMRHAVSNFRVSFRNADDASVTFTLIFFSTMGQPSGLDHADPAAVADVRMDCQRGADGHWRIAMFDSNQTFKRPMA